MIDYLNIKTIRVGALRKLQSESGAIELFDVRTPAEFEERHAAGARNIPLNSFDPEVVADQRSAAGRPMYFICEVGIRSAHACAMMLAAGIPHVVNVEGGTQAWTAAGFSVEHGV